ncbi:hypothetical protein [Rubrivirga sp.]|uniref:hypothetical protein n=1 Tax=Rubrivirga sp. TaxID=1885344 RepID=UPI003B51640C
MLRLTFVLALALGLGACDSAPSAPPASSSPPPTAMARSADVTPFQITNSARVWTEGETVILEVNGQQIEVSAGEGYVISQALGRASFDALDESIKEEFPGYEPDDGKGYPTAGNGGIEFQGIIFGPGKRPPLPPPPDWNPDILDRLIGGSAKVVEIRKGLNFEKASGGWISR